MEKVLYLGQIPVCGRLRKVFVTIRINKGRFSMSGVIGPLKNGDTYMGCSAGQCGGQIRAGFKASKAVFNIQEGWNSTTVAALLATWDTWHLNDLRAGCEHQEEDWDLDAKITEYSYGYGERYREHTEYVLSGKCKDYAEYITLAGKLAAMDQVVMDTWKAAPTDEIFELMNEGYVCIRKRTTIKAIHVNVEQHPSGLLSKPCGVCGYKYGSAWTTRELPQEVITWFDNLSQTMEVYPWA